MSGEDMRYALRSEPSCTTGVGRYVQIHDVDQSRDIRPESGLPFGVGHAIGVASSDRSRAYDWSREIPAL
jgi:hypothetical protein